MSGGVDSSLAAARLKEDGYEVIGLTMQIWPSPEGCGLEAVADARKVADKLGIPHYVVNLKDIFAEKVIADFCLEYGRGRTPNPCIRCNRYIKLATLLEQAEGLGADFIATGHYARVEPAPDGYRLLTAVDPAKDQSYFLYTLGQRELRRLLLPIGNLHEAEVRRLAVEMGLPTAARRSSQDICFIPDNDYRSLVARQVPPQAGDIVDTSGRVLGKHSGLAGYTVGQRQGLGLASGERRYVLGLDVARNRLVVGTRGQLLASGLRARRLSWVLGEAPDSLAGITAKVRYRSPAVAASLQLDDGVARVDFERPQWAVAPGQAVVFYRGEAVLGGGIIEAPELPHSARMGLEVG